MIHDRNANSLPERQLTRSDLGQGCVTNREGCLTTDRRGSQIENPESGSLLPVDGFEEIARILLTCKDAILEFEMKTFSSHYVVSLKIWGNSCAVRW